MHPITQASAPGRVQPIQIVARRMPLQAAPLASPEQVAARRLALLAGTLAAGWLVLAFLGIS